MTSEQTLEERLRKVRIVVVDVDGVLTDGRLTFNSKGIESKTFNVQDGYGLQKLQQQNVAIGIITGRESTMVQERARELGIRHVMQGRVDKGAALLRMLENLALTPEQTLYVGDDEPDIAAMKIAGVAVAVANAVATVKEMADWVTTRHGGDGAVREVCDKLHAAQR